MCTKQSPKVFISYSHDSEQHKLSILGLSDLLCSEGVDCEIDQYINGAPSIGWIRWMENQIESADFVLVICTENYLNRFKGADRLGGRGVNFEGLLINQTLYDQFLENTKFIPLIPENGNINHVPLILKGGTPYKIDTDYQALYRVLTNQPKAEKPPIGPRTVLDPAKRSQAPESKKNPLPQQIARPEIHRPKPSEPLPPGDPAYTGRYRQAKITLAVVSGIMLLIASAWGVREYPLRQPIHTEGVAYWAAIPVGGFCMGSRPADKSDAKIDPRCADSPIDRDAKADETPLHWVEITKPFLLARHETTIEEYQRYTYDQGLESPSDYGFGRDLSEEQRKKLPVVGVSWHDALAYAAWLSKKTGRPYRLPREAEWEYAARAGTQHARYWEDEQSPKEICNYANLYDQSGKTKYSIPWDAANCSDGFAETAPVGSYPANPWGLSDMVGSVWEWTCSAYTENGYDGSENRCADTGQRVVRGGSWYSSPDWLRSAYRNRQSAVNRSSTIGFRLAQDP